MGPLGDEHYFETLAGPNDTRLLHLAPGADNDGLVGKLEHVNLDHNLRYEALSYEWGNPQKKYSITLSSGSRIHITESLYHALRDIRHSSSSEGDRVIWADGICINQRDISEREHQVSIMRLIYRRAIRVITYIGPETDDSSPAIDFACHLRNFALWQQQNLTDNRHDSVEDSVSKGLPPAQDPQWKAVRGLILRGWVSRCWCAQAFILHEEVIVRCGRTELPDWHLLADIVHFAVIQALPTLCLPETPEDPDSLRECHTYLADLRTSIISHRCTLDLLELLKLTHPFRATDPRDKVYSLLGFLANYNRKSLRIDYQCPVEELYIAVARTILTESPTLNILYSNLGKKALHLPSWVPDWSTWQYGSHGTACESDHMACGSTQPELRLHHSTNRFDVTGCLISKIVQVSDRVGPHFEGPFRPINAQQRQWLNEQERIIQQLEPYPGGIDSTDVLWKTLIANTTLRTDVETTSYKPLFIAHLNCTENSSMKLKLMAKEFYDAVRRRSRYRRLAVTENGYFGGIPEGARVGDWVCMFHGGRYLFVVRQVRNYFTYIGHAYIHGLMQGEVLHFDWYAKHVIPLV